MIARLAVLAALACGCTRFAHVTARDAPGNVDLGTPMAHENGNPERFAPPADPGRHDLLVWAMPYLGGSSGHKPSPTKGVNEAGIELRFETPDDGQVAASAWAITTGLGIAQWRDHAVNGGPLYAELNRRFLAGVYPIDIGVGPALYADDPDIGAQVSLRIAVPPGIVMHIRATALLGGVEGFAGVALLIPVFFGGSR